MLKSMTKAEVLKLADEVGAALKGIGANQIAKLAKAAPEESPAPEQTAPPAAPPEATPMAPEATPAAPPSEPPMAPEGNPEAPPQEGAPQDGPPQEDGQEAPPSFEQLVQIYQSLPPEDLEIHAEAIKAAMGGGQEQGQEAPPPAPAPEATPAPMPAPMPEPGMGKSEKALADRLVKAESNMETMAKALEILLTPQPKAVSPFNYVPMAKSEKPVVAKKAFEDMSSAEVHAALSKVSATDKLSKSERACINSFYSNPSSVEITDLEVIVNKL